MTDGYKIVKLNDLISVIGEEDVESILSDFSCPINLDIEQFIKHTAIPFEKQSISRTYLVFASKKGNKLIAYYTLASKSFTISSNSRVLTSGIRKRLNKFGEYDKMWNLFTIPVPLIAQLGKNFTDNLNTLITGDELLKMACDEVRQAQALIGGKYTYLECEDKSRLIEFYERNGFVNFGKRQLDKCEKKELYGEYLIQMLKYIK